MNKKDEPDLTRRRFLVGAIAAAGVAVVVKPEPAPSTSTKPRPPGTRWIGHV